MMQTQGSYKNLLRYEYKKLCLKSKLYNSFNIQLDCSHAGFSTRSRNLGTQMSKAASYITPKLAGSRKSEKKQDLFWLLAK